MKLKKILILNEDNDWNKRLPGIKNSQREAYEFFYTRACKEYGLEIFRANLNWYKTGTFNKAWTYKDNVWIKLKNSIKPDIIMDWAFLNDKNIEKKREILSNFITTTPLDLQLLVDDKLMTNMMFSDMTVNYFTVHNNDELKLVLPKIKSSKVVLKPRFGAGGYGIKILTKYKATKTKILGRTVLEEFLDSSKGVPGIYKGVHDFSVIITGTKLTASFIRTAAPGTKLCNVSQGGSIIPVPLNKIPQAIKRVLKIIERKLVIFPYKIYSADFFFKNQKPLLIELNSKSMISLPAEFFALESQIQYGYLDYLSSIVYKNKK